MEHLRLMPSARPPHREAPDCSAEHRAAMLQLAVAGEPRLSCDPRELQRSGKSYTIDSLLELRAELGEQAGLCMVLGCDALLDIAQWHRWQALLDCAHIIVLARPGWVLPQSGKVAQWLAAHRLEDSAATAPAPRRRHSDHRAAPTRYLLHGGSRVAAAATLRALPVAGAGAGLYST